MNGSRRSARRSSRIVSAECEDEETFDEPGRIAEVIRETGGAEGPCPNGCGLSTWNHATCHDCVSELRKIVEVQAETIEILQTQRNALSPRRSFSCPELRGEMRRFFLELNKSLEAFDNKVDLLTEKIMRLSYRLKKDRRCRGYCIKHIRTMKCFCRGFQDPHRCCGQHGGYCDC